MNPKKDEPLVELRKRAKQTLNDRRVEEADPNLAKLIHELEVHQIELELQNEELRRTQKELEASRNEHYGLFESAPVGFVIIGRKGLIVRTNRVAEEMLGRYPEGLSGMAFSNLIYPEDLVLYSSLMRELARHHEGSAELRLRGNRRPIYVQIKAYGLLHEEGGFALWHFAITDITAQKDAETTLKHSHDELELLVQARTVELEKEVEKRTKFANALRESGKKVVHQSLERKRLAQKLVDLLEKDRRDVAMALHDQIGSLLTGAKLEIERLESELPDSLAADGIARIKQSMTEVMTMIRDISSHLRPAALERFGLVQSVTSLIEEVEKQSGVKIRFHANIAPGSIPPEKELALYRVIQESLNNVTKHAEAREVFITLAKRDNDIRLSIEDDGKGFFHDKLDRDSFPDGHLGIAIMKERVSQFGGTLTVESDLGHGTHVSAVMPL